MSTVITISGNIHPANSAFNTLVKTLTQLAIHTTHSPANELFSSRSKNAAWFAYETQLAFYEAIRSAPFHIMFNDQPIDETVGRQVLYAIANNRPILMTGAATFSADISPFTRGIITAHVRQFHSINLPELTPDELKSLISKLTEQDYELSDSNKVLIQSRIKAHFRRLLDEARDIYVARS